MKIDKLPKMPQLVSPCGCIKYFEYNSETDSLDKEFTGYENCRKHQLEKKEETTEELIDRLKARMTTEELIAKLREKEEIAD